MRRRRSPRELPEPAWSRARARLWHWDELTAQEQARVEHAALLLLTKRWEAASGFSLDDEMRATIAAQAAMLHLALDGEPFSNVSAVVVHPTTIVLRGERPGPSPGVMTDAPLPTLGHTSAHGPVFIAWDTVERELASPTRTTNVILHEFAHKIDALTGTMDGTPPLGHVRQVEEWVAVCTKELQALRGGERSALLRPYAAKTPSEFFAVATESFFEQPVALRAEKPALYDVLARFYGQDTAARVPRAEPVVVWRYE